MSSLEKLQQAGQRIWLDYMRRDLLTSGTLQSYIDDYAVTGLTSNPTIFQKAIGGSDDYDRTIAERRDLSPEALFQELAIEDLQGAADLFRPVFERTHGTDGFVSLEVSPELIHDAGGSIDQARRLFSAASRDNLLIKVPGTTEGLIAIEELIATGTPVNITLLFSVEQYAATAEAYMRGIERRIADGLDPNVASVASLFVSRWDVKSNSRLPDALKNRLGIAIATAAYVKYRQLLQSERWKKLAAAGAQPQMLLMASTGTKDPACPDTYYVEALAFEDTINTIPEETLHAFAEHGKTDPSRRGDPDTARQIIADVTDSGIDLGEMAQELQQEGGDKFSKSFRALIECLRDKREHLAEAGATT